MVTDDELPAGVTAEQWRRFPRAKQRLILHGPGDGGGLAIFETLLIAAAEAALHDVLPADAERLCRSIPFDAVEPGKLTRKLRELPRIVERAFNPPDGKPILTGCPRNESRSGNVGASRMRNRFAPYCDDQCARTCGMLRARRAPDQLLAESPFAPIYESSLWVESGKIGLGAAGLLVWEQLALLALASANHTVQASQRYVAARLNDRVPHRTVSVKLRALEELGLVAFDRPTGLRTVRVLSAQQVAQLEERYGTRALVERRQEARRAESEAYLEWLNEADDRCARWHLSQSRTRTARVGNLPKTPAYKRGRETSAL